MPKLSQFLIEELYNEFEGKYKFNLSSATLPALSLNDLKDLMPVDKQGLFNQELLELKLDYSEQFGDIKFRNKLAEKYSLEPDNFLVTTGASEGIQIFSQTLFQAGDQVIVQKPIYQSLYQIMIDIGVEIINWDYDLNLNWNENHKNLKALTKTYKNFKGLVLNNPNNPLGIGFGTNQLKEIINTLEDRLLIVDEVFIDISKSQLRSAIELYDNAIIISDLSKSYSMPGLRLGWIASRNQSLLNQFSSYKNYLSLRSSTLSEAIGVWVLEYGETILSENKKLIAGNTNYLLNSKLEIGLKANEIEGLCVFPKTHFDTNNLFKKLLKEKQTFLVPGYCFGKKYSNHFRLGLGNKNFKQSLENFFEITKSLN